MAERELLAQRKKKAVYREGNTVIKVFDDSYSKDVVLSQALNQARVEKTGLNIPKILGVTTQDDKWIITLEYVEGKTLDVLMEEHPEKIDEYLDKFVETQMLIHSKRVSGLLKIKEKMAKKISEANIDDSKKYDLHTRLDGMPNHVKLCHGDYNPSNIVVDSKGEFHILDWSHATQGNASADVARTFLRFRLNGQEQIAKKYLDLYCEKTGVAKSYVQRWIPIVACSQSVKNIPEEKELLYRWLDVIEY